MYVYSKKSRKKAYVIAGLSVAIVVCSALTMLLKVENDKKVAIMEEEVHITLPQEESTFQLPFKVEAVLVKEYFDGEDHEVSDYTNFEGVYRPNQGVDYAYNDENFEVVSMMDGEVVEIKEDPLFGLSLTLQSGHIKITYQSLKEVKVKEKDKVKQETVIGLAGGNNYNPELGNHLHISATVNDVLINPKQLIGKKIEEIK